MLYIMLYRLTLSMVMFLYYLWKNSSKGIVMYVIHKCSLEWCRFGEKFWQPVPIVFTTTNGQIYNSLTVICRHIGI